MKRNVQEGYIIEEDDLEIITVGAYNLPADIIKDKLPLIGFNMLIKKDAKAEITKVIEQQEKYANNQNK